MDDDLDGLSGAPDEDLSLPKATVAKLIQEMMPKDMTCAKETRDVLAECCVEFIHLLSSEANEICEKEAKKTIAGDHVIAALKSLGFEDFVDEVMEVYEDHTKTQKDREKKTLKPKMELSAEEAAAIQERMFAEAKARMMATATGTPPASGNGSS
ncbi:negative cofactor 2 transcription regulator complex subunit ncb2 [Rhizophlyctis rosea]|uniref:Negative cofactor 2 transcription regulator complex subunit ncb2 n=1 Tax=Rhizophlyctis rosea TaxID=64517 RepID=A0AAD5SFD8_9FUNG|nr:negative cofactor 2 transcription regulator complex subunit ncb2 [Rhizophlyctis rosea]